MGEADRRTIRSGVAGVELMEAAGWAVANAIRSRFSPRRVVVLAGPGNNGGDGFVVARLLDRAGWPVRLALLGARHAHKGDAAIMAERWHGPIESLSLSALDGADLVVDALFGAGLSRPLEGKARAIVEAINRQGLACVAVDVPSGVEGDSGRILGAAPQAGLTVTFFRAKPGHHLRPGRDCVGELVVADIGIGEDVLAAIRPRGFANHPDLWSLPIPGPDSHKYKRGHALVVGGAAMTGAARLAARAARRVGAGMVTLASPASVAALYAGDQPGLIVHPMDSDTAIIALIKQRKISAAVIGPGLGTASEFKKRILSLLGLKLPMVLDADALTLFERDPKSLFAAIKGPVLLTPHEGEFRRLFPWSDDRLAAVRQAAKRSGAVVLLKGSDTVIAAPNGLALINEAPADLATAGSGDVLAGLACGLLAQGLDPLAAAGAASWLHAEAGRQAGAGLIAEDLVDYLPAILAKRRGA